MSNKLYHLFTFRVLSKKAYRKLTVFYFALCIVIYSYNKTNEMHNRYMSYSLCWQLASKQSAWPVWHIPIAVCTMLYSWWWTEELSETCRVLFQKIIWEIGASRWFYYKNISRCTVLWTSKGNEGLEQPTCEKIRDPKGAERLKMTFIARVIQPPVSINLAKFIGL